MRGYENYNFPAFDSARDYLTTQGWDVISPADIDRDEGFVTDDGTAVELTDKFDIHAVLRRDLRAITECDAIALLPGWQKSEGVAAELSTATALGLEVYEVDGDLHVFQRLEDVPVTAKVTTNGSGEVRVVDPTTGGAKGQKLARFDLIPAGPLLALAEHFGRGSLKYEDRNWERGYAWSLSFGALQRHAWAMWGGEDIDPETGSPHMVAVAWHALALLEFAVTHPELDDRPSYGRTTSLATVQSHADYIDEIRADAMRACARQLGNPKPVPDVAGRDLAS